MSRWKATMPREKPEEGKADYVVAIRHSHGLRIELSGTVSGEIAEKFIQAVLDPDTDHDEQDST